ncbi:DNA polymerase III subunit beta family protein [Mycoplasma sp. 480]|uniref:DNA polymerase III subunit beta family protein n=1 Tax=Mycoplasma sp. 480 TaxID=3440155 RepID=UPI003F518910
MNFKIEKKYFEKEFERIGVSINTLNFIPSLRSVKIELRQEGLYLYGSDGEISIIGHISSENIKNINELGSFLINYSMLKNIIKKTEGILEFKIEDTNLTIKNKDDLYKINIQNDEDFPNIRFDLSGQKISIHSKDFKKAIKDTSFAATIDSSEVILDCININAMDGNLRISATDRYRISTEILPIESHIEFDISIIARNLKNFIPNDYEGELEIYVEDNKIETIVENTKIQCKVIDFPYKDISNVFPNIDDLVYKIEIDKKELSELISKASILSNDQYFKLNVSVNQEEFTMSGNKEETGFISVKTKEMKFESSNSELNFSINHRYLKDAISVYEGLIYIFVDKKIRKVYIVSPSNKNNKQLIGTT